MLKSLLIPADPAAPIRVIDVADEWKALASAIGAEFVEFVRSSIPDLTLVVDDQGAYSKPVNRLASLTLHPAELFGDVLVFLERRNAPEEAGLESLNDHALDVLAMFGFVPASAEVIQAWDAAVGTGEDLVKVVTGLLPQLRGILRREVLPLADDAVIARIAAAAERAEAARVEHREVAS